MKNLKFAMLAWLLLVTVAFANTDRPTHLSSSITRVMQDYYKDNYDSEYFSGISVAVSVPDQDTASFYLGTQSRELGSRKIDENTVFDIGSITKSFTSAIILRSGIDLDKTTVGDALPQYSKWG